jgi:HEAT repeat protein
MTGSDRASRGRRQKRPAPEEAPLAALAALEPTSERSAQNALIGASLSHRHFRVVAKAASLAGQRGLREQVPQLLAAYPRFLDNPVKQDPHCLAKQAIARALVELDASDVTFFLAGIRYRQLEPAWGGPMASQRSEPNDSAVDVRCSCAMGLVATGYSRAIPELTELLADPEWRVRAGAARAISCGRPGEAEAVLRLKAQMGDAEAEVLGECFTGLLSVAADECVAFVAGFLSSGRGSVPDYAALALGESRHPAAVEHLRTAWRESSRAGGLRAVLIRAAGLHRSPSAFDWLLEIIDRGEQADAEVAVEALSVYARDARLGERLQAALAKRAAATASGNGTPPGKDPVE